MQLVAALAVDVLRGALGMEHQVRARHPVAVVQLSQALLFASPPALPLQRNQLLAASGQPSVSR